MCGQFLLTTRAGEYEEERVPGSCFDTLGRFAIPVCDMDKLQSFQRRWLRSLVVASDRVPLREPQVIIRRYADADDVVVHFSC